MPTYEYVCKDCGYRFEEFQKIIDAPLTACPKCGGHVKRIISGGNGIIFKGSGFYETDYKNIKKTDKKKHNKIDKPKKDQSKAA